MDERNSSSILSAKDSTDGSGDPPSSSSVVVDSPSSTRSSSSDGDVIGGRRRDDVIGDRRRDDVIAAAPEIGDRSRSSMVDLGRTALPQHVSDALLRRLNAKKLLDNRTLQFFTPARARLRHVEIKDCKSNAINHDGLAVLRLHDLESLRLINLSGVKLDRLVEANLNERTVRRGLRLLDLSGTLRTAHYRLKNDSTFAKHRLPIDFVLGNVTPSILCQFSNLQTLIVARTHFDDFALSEVCDNLTNLEFLDISHTLVTRLEPLLLRKNRLKAIVAQKPKFSDIPASVGVLCDLEAVEILDISDYPKLTSAMVKQQPGSAPGAGRLDSCRLSVVLVVKLASGRSRLKNLRIFDISGGQANFDVNIFNAFLVAHSKLQYCGLLMSNACYFDCVLAMSKLKVSGEANKSQVFHALETYWARDYFCSRSMYLLFRMLEMEFHSFTSEDKHFCIEHIIKGLTAHLNNLSVQMAGTACLYNFCLEDRAQILHPSCLREIVDRSLTSVEIHSKTLQLHKNVWLTLCNDHILQSGTFDMFRCCLAALESMVNCNDAQVTRITVAIVSILAAKISTEMTARLGANRTYMKYLLHVVNQKIDAQTVWLAEHAPHHFGAAAGQQQQPLDPEAMGGGPGDQALGGENPAADQQPGVPPPDLTLKFTLSALWNLTDESPTTCLTFLEENGLGAVLRALDSFRDNSIEAKVLGLLNNVAEVDHLKAHLINEPCLLAVKRLLLSNRIEVSYFSAGILAHLCANLSWDHFHPTWDDCLELLLSTIRSWEKPEFEMVAYRSFKPFFSLLRKSDLPAVQFWALWAINHVCSNNKERYIDMFKTEGGRDALEKVRDNTMIKYPYIYILCNNILELLS